MNKNPFKREKTMGEHLHHRFREIFTGRKNIFTATLAFLGAYFVAYPLVNIVADDIGYYQTMAIGVFILIVMSYYLDTYHKGK